MSNIYSAVAHLKANWHTLPDFERAQAVLPIICAGVSRRNLAITLNVSDGTVRNLLLILEADPSDQELFRRGEMSRSELIRCVRGSHDQRVEPSKKEPEQSTQMRDPAEVCQEILNWLAEDAVRASFAPKILEEALRKLNGAAEAGKLPRISTPIDIATEEIIRFCRPDPETLGPDFLDLALYSSWAARWVFCLMADPELCSDALSTALLRVRTKDWNSKL